MLAHAAAAALHPQVAMELKAMELKAAPESKVDQQPVARLAPVAARGSDAHPALSKAPEPELGVVTLPG
eukprot:4769633-Pyramimonas_sp.AAC.1